MTKLAWAALPALTLSFWMGCGSDSAPSPLSKDASARATGGREGGSAGHHSGGAHDGGGGLAETGIVDSGASLDTTPPDFGGATKIQVLGEDRTRIGWALATDPPPGSTQDEIAYRVYRAAKAGAEDFTTTRRCGDPLPDAGPIQQANAPCYAVAPASATSVIVHDEVPNHEFWYVARAVDAAGNEDQNTTEVHAKNTDTTAPDFGGVGSVSVDSATSIEVTWNAGYDLGATDPSLIFNVYVGEGAPPDTTQAPNLVTKPGQHSAVVTGLSPLTSYYVIVRASDPAGNIDTNTRVLSITTPEGVPPTFDGAKLAVADGTTIRVFWPPATDNVTDSASMLYDVYESLTSHRQNFAKPSYTSKPGASSITIVEPNAGTRYYFVVRARDAVGNRDTNPPHEVAVTTGGLPDIIAPSFDGAKSIVSATPSTLELAWDATNESNVTYYVYASLVKPVPLTIPALTTRALFATLVGLSSNTLYNVVVIAQDAAGNKSANPLTVTATTLARTTDTSPPTGTGTPGANMTAGAIPTKLQINWTGATDDVDGANVRYHLCVSTVQSDCVGTAFASHLLMTTPFGTTNATLATLTPRTTYFVDVRAEDHGGNLEQTDHFVQSTTPTSWATNVSKILLYRCVACHDYNVASTLVDIPGNLLDDTACSGPLDTTNGCQLNLIDPGRPQFSIVYRKVNEFGLKAAPFSALVPNHFNGLQEPRDTTDKLSTEEDSTLRDWIAQGAFSN